MSVLIITRSDDNESVSMVAATPGAAARAEGRAADYAELAAFFDAFAADEPLWRARNRPPGR